MYFTLNNNTVDFLAYVIFKLYTIKHMKMKCTDI